MKKIYYLQKEEYSMGGSENLDERQMVTIGIVIVFFALFLILVNVLDNKSINGIKAKQVGDGQHGTARWATKQEIRRSFSSLPFAPSEWRQGKNLPNLEGTVVACRGTTNTTALVDTGDVHTLMIGAAGVGKTAYFLYPNAQQLLDNMEQRENAAFASTIFGLFVSLSHAIEDDYNKNHKKLQSKIDSKLQRMIRKHKQELGIRDEHDMTMA